MKQIQLYYTKKEQVQLIINFIFYSIFFYFTTDLILSNDSLIGAVLLIFLIIIFLGITLLHEYLNFLYKSAIYYLTKEGNPIQGIKQISRVQKLDLLKSYSGSIYMFYNLAYLDMNEPLEALALIDQTDVSAMNKDATLIKYYTNFRANLLLDNRTKTKQAYKKLVEIKDLKIKGKKFSPLFAWNDIHAEFEIMMNNSKKAIAQLSKSPVENMNNREKAHHHYLYGLAYKQLNEPKKAANHFALCVSLGGLAHEATLAKQYLKEQQ